MKIKPVQKSDEYLTLRLEASTENEANDCAVKAIALTCGVTYKTAREVLKEQGRKDRKGTYRHQLAAAVKALGHNATSVSVDNFIKKYPGRHINLKHVTTHHPDRFHEVWEDGNSHLFFTHGHVLAVVNGVNHDHTRGHAMRVTTILKVT